MSLERPLVLLIFLPLVVAFVWALRRSHVGFGRPQMRLMLAARLVVASALVAALCGIDVARPTRGLALTFAVDVSASIAPDRRAASERIIEAVSRRADPDAEVRVVSFAESARLGAGVVPANAREALHSDLAAALNFAALTMSPAMTRRIVLLSDGRQTVGDARTSARALGAHGVQIDCLPLPPSSGRDAAVRDLVVPSGAHLGAATTVTAVLSSSRAAEGTLTLTENDTPIGSREVQLEEGSTSVRLPLVPRASGLARYRASIEVKGDLVEANNRFERLVEVAGDPRILVVDPRDQELFSLVNALGAQGNEVELRATVPASLEELSRYDAVVLSEVPPRAVDRLTQGALEAYVRELGGGLIVITGPVGLGTDPAQPLTRLMPVALAGVSERQVPPVALVLVVDRSGSMAGQKLEYAKSAAAATVDALPESAQVGVIAFDADYSWIVPFQPVSDKAAIKNEIATLASGGGTRFYPALQDAFYTLSATEAAARHIVLLTDGLSTDGDNFDLLVGRMQKSAVTLSTVAISKEADQKLLSHLAALGGGRYHFTERASDVPRIFLDEAHTAVANALRERPVQARAVTRSQEIIGLSLESAPPLRGHLSVRAKPTSEVILGAPDQEPLLVRWQSGLGQVDVFTSDVKARWAAEWLAWPDFGRLFSQIIRAAMRKHARDDLVTRVERRGQKVHVTVDAASGAKVHDGLTLKALVRDGASIEHQLPLPQTGPGLYEGELALEPNGSIMVRPLGEAGAAALSGRPAMLDEPYAAEFRNDGDDVGLLRAIAAESGGRYAPPIEEVGRVAGKRGRRPVPIWTFLAGLALLFFVPDLVLKRVRFERWR